MTTTHHPPADRDRGVGLVEVLMTMSLMGMLLVPLSALILTTVRTSALTQRRATTEAILATATSLIGRTPMADPCDVPALTALLSGRVSMPANYRVDLSPDCSDGTSTAYAIVTVTVTDPTGETSTRQTTAVTL